MAAVDPKAKSVNKPVFYLVHLLGCLLLLMPALYNGYGILNSDFGTYLPSGFIPEMPVDRPITYGILLRIFSLNGLSLWLVLLAQAFFVSNLVIRLVKHFAGAGSYLLISTIIITMLSFATSLSWTVSQLQPDIYTTIGLMCGALLIVADERRSVTVLTSILYFVSIATHASHLVLFVMLWLSVIVFFRKTVFKQRRKRILILLLLSVLPVLTMMPIFAKSKHIFFMASILEKGILKQYLDDNCAQKGYKLCAYKEALPASPDDFMWDSSSPLYKEGGIAAVKPEYSAIISDINSSPKYMMMFAERSLAFTGKQLVTFYGPGNPAFDTNTYVHKALVQYVPNDTASFNASLQQQGELPHVLALPNKIFNVFIILSLVLLIALFFYKRPTGSLKIFLFLCIAAIIFNAWDCATFSVVNARYGFKMIWLLPFCVALLLTPRRIVK